MSDNGPGLREIKKQLTHETIADAALRLTLEKGFDQVTIEEIANLAFVSPRTFSNYFSCKEEAVVTASSQYWLDLINGLPDRPPEEPPLVAVRNLILDAVSGSDDELDLIAEKMMLGRRYPALRPFEVAQYTKLEEQLRDAVAERTGLDSTQDMQPWLIATSAVAAMKASMGLWLSAGADPAVLPGLVRDAFDQVINGVEQPDSAGAELDGPPAA